MLSAVGKFNNYRACSAGEKGDCVLFKKRLAAIFAVVNPYAIYRNIQVSANDGTFDCIFGLQTDKRICRLRIYRNPLM